MILPLFLAIPLLGAALSVLFPNRIFATALSLLLPAASIAGGVWLFQQGPQAHAVGLYVGGVAIPFAADAFSAVMIVTTGIVTFTSNWFAAAAGETRARFYPALTLMLLGGVNGALLTADLFNLFVMVEVMLLPSYGLMAMTGTRSRLAAGRTFVLSNLLASTMLLLGVSFVYGVSGTVNIAALAGAADSGPLVVAFGLVVIALVIKAGVFPMHTWLPRTYPATSPAVMGLFSGLHTKVAVYALFRIYVVIFDCNPRWTWFIIVVMVVAMLVGSFAGLAERTIRRVLAYQMVSGMPFILVMLAFGTENALAAGLLYTVHHMITMGALILTGGAIEETYGTGTLSKLSGLARRDPWVAAVFAAASFSIVGFPPFSGMWGKVFLVLEAARQGDARSWVVIAAIIVASIGSLFSMLRLWRKVFWGRPPEQYPVTLVVPWAKLAPGAALLAVSVVMFFAAGPLTDAILHGTHDLFNVSGYSSMILSDNPVGVVR
ncbi:monovalent cation/H+ antiporter subunit D family protein [Corynebacterium epidermidicanis]|uniref:Formate hydrogenlyase subunit 3/multisubunit Na+/H+ antiporter, MnhD subunit n=1 Tax=Corynebacterium epidermidicanis TaxID=1050174 RepID=A0A0G3GM09_9CORY|nr:monovalent cation/H+ antiporter subunit D family protein [Corynebacterium epidermidicanis]AKK02149.1 formate hydrogenlyase subunit 3/multisubunit Na+/H+ antiporter, MnhD subunit [Corynebacterium epidermidicanis]